MQPDRVDALRDLLGAHDRDVVTVAHFRGVQVTDIAVAGLAAHGYRPSGEVAFVVVGPAAKIRAEIHSVEEDGDVETVTVALTFPIDHSNSPAALDAVAALAGAILDARNAGDTTSGELITGKSGSPEVTPVEAALAFYAEPASYVNATPRTIRPVIDDGGRRARQALELLRAGEDFRRSAGYAEEYALLLFLEQAWRDALRESGEPGAAHYISVERTLERLSEIRGQESPA